MKRKKRKVSLVVISDTHLGSIGAGAEELYRYLKSIDPKTVILNGDIVDVWQFSKRYWDKYHTKVLKQLLEFISNGVQVYYVAGNHDEALRRFVNFELAGFKIVNKVILNLDGKKAWFFHGDVFDIAMKHSRWLTRIGGYSYDLLIGLNALVNKILCHIGKEKLSFSKTIKNRVKAAVSFIGAFEQTVADIAIHNNYDYVVCGHIHQPCIKDFSSEKGKTTYLNSGDWIENMTALEYHKKHWSHNEYKAHKLQIDPLEEFEHKNAKALFSDLVLEMNLHDYSSL